MHRHVEPDGRCCHINHDGRPVYPGRYRAIGPYVGGLAVAHATDGRVVLLDEGGRELDLCGERYAWLLPGPDGCIQAQTVDGRHGVVDARGRFRPHSTDPEWEARRQVVRIARMIYERGYNVSIDGNISVRLPDDTLLMSPSGCHLGFLRPEDLVVTDLHGRVLRGRGQPTSEYRLHTALHHHRPDCRCVVHVHSPFAVAASIAGVDLAQTYATVAPIPTTAYARISSAQSPASVEPFMRDYNWAILPRHGTVAWAETPWDAFLRVEGLEHAAKIAMHARAAGPIEPLSPERRLELLTFWGLEHLEVPCAG